MSGIFNMSWTRRFFLVLIAFATALACAVGCAPAPVSTQPREGIEVVDCAQRQVAVPQDASRIACLYAYTGQVCVLLGCEDRIVAVVNGLKRDHLMERKVENLADMSSPYNKGSINVEELAAVKPDITFVRKDILQDAGELEKLDNMDIRYIVVDYITMDDQKRSIEVMGQSLGCEDRARAYLDYYDKTIELVKERLASIPESERKRVYHSVNEVVRTDVPDTLSFQILDVAGCVNVVEARDELRVDGDKGMATVEQIYVWDPDVVLSNEPAATTYFNTDSKFSGLRAVREGKVYQLPVGISRWGHPGSVETPIATLYIAQLMYPEAFADIDMEQEIKDFYSTYFDIELSAEDVASIMSGEGMREAREGGPQQ